MNQQQHNNQQPLTLLCIADIWIQSAKIMGNVKEDTDNNGMWDVPIPPVTVELRTVLKDGKVVTFPSTTTSPDGKFDFQRLLLGKCMLVELNPPGFLDIKGSDRANPNKISVDVATTDSPVNQFVDKHRATLPPM